MELSFKGGCREVGRSSVLVNGEVLLDYGLKPGDTPAYPLNSLEPKAVLVSHGHLDHCGAVPNLMYLEPEVFMTPPTAALTHMLGKDTLKLSESGLTTGAPFDQDDLQKLARKTQKIDYGIPFKTQGYTAQFYGAGHIPGASSIYLEDSTGHSLFYTGDLSQQDTRLVAGAEAFPKANTLIIESTYFGEDHAPRKETENKFIDSLQSTLDIGGTVLIPAFAIGRTQEILMLLHAHGIRAYIDGMGVEAYKILKKYPGYLKNPELMEKASRYAMPVRPHMRASILNEPSVIVTTAGMLNGGPVLYYLKKLYKDPTSRVMLTGYQVEGTNGRTAVESGFIEDEGAILSLKPKVEQYDFSAHCGDRELKNIVKEFCSRGTDQVFVMHGSRAEAFAEWIEEEIGVKAYAPMNGDSFVL